MAYLDPENMFAARADAAPPISATPGEAGFSPLEWSVIALAKRDTVRSLTTPGPLSRAMGSLFGRGIASPLADSRLEALRRVAVYAWRRGFAVPLAEIARFRAAGFSPAQLETLVLSVTGITRRRDVVAGEA
jgi:hypothetical protein